ncbi:MAG: avidin/streptavidin family protein [Legionella sp.]|uniref:avidin/streptavidin family protein n=1 Tax=Legionella sp. TaxID=459 RepID=UPI0039E50FB4
MKLSVLAGVALLGLFVNQAGAADQATTLHYKNLRNSTLELNFSNGDNVTGLFTTAVATKECEDVVGVARPVTGYVLGNAITFSVEYPTCGSVVSFSGHLNEDKSKITTIAIVTHQNTKHFGSQFISNDVFAQQ